MAKGFMSRTSWHFGLKGGLVPRRTRFAALLALAIGVWVLTGCERVEAIVSTLTPPPTRLAAELVGRLINTNGCLQVNAREVAVTYTLAWPPELDVSIQPDDVIVTTEDGQHVILHLGETIRVSGGVVSSVQNLDPAYQENLPAHCPAPFWLVGTEVGPA